MPLLSTGMVDEDRPVASMILVMVVNVGLDRPEVRKDLIKPPLVIAASGPAIRIIRDAPVEGRRVDGAGPSRHLAPGDRHRRCLRGGPGDELPVMLAAQERDGMTRRSPPGWRTRTGVKAGLDLCREMLKFR